MMDYTPERIWATGNGETGSWNAIEGRMKSHMPDGWQTEYVRATDYDALAAKLAAAERRERQLLDTTATCRTLRRELNTAKAELAAADAMIEAQQKDYASNNVRFAEAEHRAKAAEAALASMQSDALAFVLFLDENYRHSFGDIAREKIRAFYARIQTGEKE